jgi:hypothetical protein
VQPTPLRTLLKLLIDYRWRAGAHQIRSGLRSPGSRGDGARESARC